MTTRAPSDELRNLQREKVVDELFDDKIVGDANVRCGKAEFRKGKVKAIHAGLECGIIGEKFPGIDMLSFGPTLEAVHSPDEKIYIDMVEKYWNFLLAILKNVN